MKAPQLRPEVQALQPHLVTWRRQIHQFPELSFREHQTSAFIQSLLSDWGVPFQAGIAETGVVALIEGSLPGPTVAIRADMDALPIQEQNEVPYRSCRESTMHACGHDGHTAIALGTVRMLQQNQQQLKGRVKVVFQPAEEGPGGAQPMIAAGVLKDPDVEAIVGLHLWNTLPIGMVGVKGGYSMAQSDRFEINIIGRGGHGAIPQQTVDAIVVGAEVITALQTIISRNVDPLKSAVVTVGRFHAGTAFNVIAQQAEIIGTVRTFDPEVSELIPRRMEQVVAGICQAHGATFEFRYKPGYPAVDNDPQVAALVNRVARDVLGSSAPVVPEVTMGGEDMSYFLKAVPGCYFFLGSANVDLGLAFPHHHPRFDFDETALGIGVELFLRWVENYALDPIAG